MSLQTPLASFSTLRWKGPQNHGFLPHHTTPDSEPCMQGWSHTSLGSSSSRRRSSSNPGVIKGGAGCTDTTGGPAGLKDQDSTQSLRDQPHRDTSNVHPSTLGKEELPRGSEQLQKPSREARGYSVSNPVSFGSPHRQRVLGIGDTQSAFSHPAVC